MAWHLWLHPAIVSEYLDSGRIRLRRAVRGHTRHPGDVRLIVRNCIDSCWNGRSFTASPGHFRVFWTRDMSFSSTALARLSETDGRRLHASLDWAMGVFTKRRSHITTTIHFFDRPVDVFEYGVDSLPLFLAALQAAKAGDLVEKYRGWLEAEVAHFVERVVDPLTGLVRSDRKFSAHRDTVVNRSNAYGNSMVALLSNVLQQTGWMADPMTHWLAGDPGRLLMEHFWKGDRFVDALGDDLVSGEANIWPFWTGAVKDEEVLATSLATLEREGFATPYPLRYETSRRPQIEVWLTRHLLPDYQGSTVWTSLGAMYLQLKRVVDRVGADREIARYVEWIERDGTYWEVMNDKGRCWVSPRWVFIGEESMLWSAIFLDLLVHPNSPPALLS